MMFWNSSAIVPALVAESSSAAVLEALAQDPAVVIWWGTQVECTSALHRRLREDSLQAAEVERSQQLLATYAASWIEVVPSAPLRRLACRLLADHPLRAADAQQLAAAITMSVASDLPCPCPS